MGNQSRGGERVGNQSGGGERVGNQSRGGERVGDCGCVSATHACLGSRDSSNLRSYTMWGVVMLEGKPSQNSAVLEFRCFPVLHRGQLEFPCNYFLLTKCLEVISNLIGKRQFKLN